jgi:hypothetical protein
VENPTQGQSCITPIKGAVAPEAPSGSDQFVTQVSQLTDEGSTEAGLADGRNQGVGSGSPNGLAALQDVDPDDRVPVGAARRQSPKLKQPAGAIEAEQLASDEDRELKAPEEAVLGAEARECAAEVVEGRGVEGASDHGDTVDVAAARLERIVGE